MATVNHVRKYNISLSDSTTNHTPGYFSLIRCLKKSGWKYKASGDGAAKDITGDPALDKWNQPATTSVANVGASAASIANPTVGRATVTGLSEITGADKGRFITFSSAASAVNNHAHQIEEILSSTSVRIDARTFAVVSDANNGAITWSIRDPMHETVGAFPITNAAWWCAQGPSVLKIPITAASVGTFRRGENIIQTSTGATGELVGYTYYNGTGWLVVAPRLRGTGAGQHGWDTGNLITGSRSGATVTQVGTALDYVTEVVISKVASTLQLQILFQLAERVGEAATLFSALATSAGCTATVPPANGGTGNAFPANAWCGFGTSTAPINISGINSLGIALLSAHVICVDAIPEQNYSADGSWALIHYRHWDRVGSTSAANDPVTGAHVHGFQRIDETEDGDVALYASICPTLTKSVNSPNRTTSGTILSNTVFMSDPGSFAHIASIEGPNSLSHCSSWKARGLSNEAFVELSFLGLSVPQVNAIIPNSRGTGTQRVISSANPYARAKDKVWLSTGTTGLARIYKGRFRWLYWVFGGRFSDSLGADPGWLQLSGGGTNNFGLEQVEASGGGALIIGPHDGTQCLVNLPSAT